MKAFVLLTAMPPTTGHQQLVQFASRLTPHVTVLVCTQPFEPFVQERVEALRQAVQTCGLRGVLIEHFDKVIPQDPVTSGFWQLWHDILTSYDVGPGDYIVASEPYGQKLAEIIGAEFMPYDIDRDLNPVKATHVREDPLKHFDLVIPEFRRNLITRVTIFGAESTGKTTLSRELTKRLQGQWLFEYARPYLEHTVNEITVRSMTAIWRGQRALQEQGGDITSSPYIIQDTDLFSTVGYWQFPHWQKTIGTCPAGLIADAQRLRSDLYLITRSNIPFEQDPLRYGGDKREGGDDYWIQVCKQYHLPYLVLDSSDPAIRLAKSLAASQQCAQQKVGALAYDRCGL